MKNLVNTIVFILFIISIFIFSSCATIFRGTSQKVYFTSEPQGAEVFVMGVSSNLFTPCTVDVKRKVKPNTYKNNLNYQQVYELKKEGYFDYLNYDYGKGNLWSFVAGYWDIYTFGIGLIVDAVNGSFRVYNKNIFGQLNLKNGNQNQIGNQSIDNVNISPFQNSPTDNFDVDKNIPVNPTKNPYRFALIIGNEDYSSFQQGLNNEVNVAFAVNDATVFKDYVSKTLGVPDENITLLINAKAMDMNRAIKKLNLLAKNASGKAEIIFYYAGHGLPSEESKEPYLMPVDVSGTELNFAIKLTDLYKQLTEFPSKKVTVFLDACFSGGARNQGLIAARGVKIKAKEGVMKGKMVVFSASSGDQSSMPYKEKKHGIFTYFLLKKLQDTKGVLTYKSLSDFLVEQVGLKSLIVNNKEQSPQTNISQEAQDEWTMWSFK